MDQISFSVSGNEWEIQWFLTHACTKQCARKSAGSVIMECVALCSCRYYCSHPPACVRACVCCVVIIRHCQDLVCCYCCESQLVIRRWSDFLACFFVVFDLWVRYPWPLSASTRSSNRFLIFGPRLYSDFLLFDSLATILWQVALNLWLQRTLAQIALASITIATWLVF